MPRQQGKGWTAVRGFERFIKFCLIRFLLHRLSFKKTPISFIKNKIKYKKYYLKIINIKLNDIFIIVDY